MMYVHSLVTRTSLGHMHKQHDTHPTTSRTNQANVLERRLFYVPSFKIYGSVAGFYDYGPPGCAIKQNITQARAALVSKT